MKKILKHLGLTSRGLSTDQEQNHRPSKKKDFMNAETTPGQLFEHYDQFLIRPKALQGAKKTKGSS